MSRGRTLQDIRLMKFEDLLGRQRRRELSQAEAASLLGVGERTFRLWRNRHEEEGPGGLRDRRIGKPSPRRSEAETIEWMPRLYRIRFADFTVKHFHEHLLLGGKYKLGYTTTKVYLHVLAELVFQGSDADERHADKVATCSYFGNSTGMVRQHPYLTG